MSEGAQQQPPASAMKKGLVKQVLSGDAVVLQGPSQGGPPKEVTVYLSNVVGPRLGKRPQEGTDGTPDEPFAWEAREALRKKIVGKTVVFVNDFTATSGREHGRVYLGGTGIHDAENVVETLVSEGWLEVRPGKQADEYVQKLLDLQEQAKSAKRGRWSEQTATAVRTVKWVIEDPRALVDHYKHKPIDAVVEQVRDGSTVRAFLLPTFEYVTVNLSGVKAPGVRVGSEGKPEEFGEEARFFVEQRLLQRDVKIVLEGVSNQNFVGSVLHPRGNIAEFLLKEGFAKCVEWSIGLTTGGPAPLRDAERYAKERKLRLWRNYTGTAGTGDRNTFTAKVIEIGLVDSISVEKDNGEELKIYFSSLRAPKREGAGEQTANVGRQFRPLYDIPFMFEGREFLRKRLVGKRVNVTVDYVQPKSDQFPEKTCCTVLVGGQNIADALVSRGLAKVVRHRGDDENRSSHYDALLTAEAQAEKAKKGLWADQTDKPGTIRVQELQGDAQRSKQFLPYLQRSQRSEGIVEFVSSGSRLRVYVPKETCLITFLLAGIQCPRGARMGPGGKPIGESEPFADEALKFTRTRSLQHEVQLEVESMDKAGGFIGYLFVPNDRGGHINLSELLVEQGLATVHFTAERSPYYNQLAAAEKSAKNARRGLWKNHVEEEVTTEQRDQANDVSDRKVNYQKVIVTEVYKGSLRFAAQTFDDGPAIESLMNNLQAELNARGVPGSYTPRRGELAAALDGENVWNRVRIESVKGGNVDVHYVDFGNRETLATSRLTALPTQFHSQQPGAREYQLALLQVPNVEHYAQLTDAEFQRIAYSGTQIYMNHEYKLGNVPAVTLLFDDPSSGTKVDLGKYLVENGFALADNRREKRLESLVTEYQEAEKKARRAHLNIWEYGDFTGNEI